MMLIESEYQTISQSPMRNPITLDILKDNSIIYDMDLNDLIESNPGLFRVIAIVGGLLIGYIIYIFQI